MKRALSAVAAAVVVSMMALFLGRLWYDTPDNAVGYAKHYSRSHDAVIRVYDAAGKVIDYARLRFGRHGRIL